MKVQSFTTLILLLTIALSVSSQEDELFVSSIYKDFIYQNCDSFYLITLKEKIKITDFIESELKKVLPKKAVREICSASNDANKLREWDTTKMNFVVPITNNKRREKEQELVDDVNNAYQILRTTYGLDTISDFNVADSLENTIIQSGVNVYNFSRIPSCYRQMYKFSRPLYSKKRDYALIAFTIHKWIPNASGFIAVYANKNGKWVRIAEINQWIS
jgi:ABC-type maltose transport system permease subunit